MGIPAPYLSQGTCCLALLATVLLLMGVHSPKFVNCQRGDDVVNNFFFFDGSDDASRTEGRMHDMRQAMNRQGKGGGSGGNGNSDHGGRSGAPERNGNASTEKSGSEEEEKVTVEEVEAKAEASSEATVPTRNKPRQDEEDRVGESGKDVGDNDGKGFFESFFPQFPSLLIEVDAPSMPDWSEMPFQVSLRPPNLLLLYDYA